MSLSPSEPISLPGRPFGRVVRSVIGYSLATALMIITPLVVFVPAALLHCAIRNGRRAAWTALAIAVLVAALVVVLPASAATANMAWSFLAAVTLSVALPSLVALPMVERGEKFGRVLVFLLISSAVGLAAIELGSRALLDFSPYAAQVAQAELSSKEIMQIFRSAGAPPSAFQGNELMFRGVVYLLPASILCQLALVFILSLLMLGRLKAWRELAARRADTEALGAYLFRNFRLPDWILFVFVLGGLTPLATGMLQKVAANTLAVVAFLYILQGLAIFRFLLVSLGVGPGGTMLGWFLLVFLVSFSGVGLLLLGVAGLFDPFFDFRHFKKRKDDSNESHSD